MTKDPAHLAWARAELGVRETPGPVSTKRIMEYRTLAGIKLGGDDGTVPWCAIFVNAALAQTGQAGSGNAMARGFLRWGVALKALAPGAIVVFSSSRGPTSGHVAIATGKETETHVEVCGGNQGDAVSNAWFAKAKVLGYRWPAGLALPTAGSTKVASSAPVKQVSDA